MKLGVVIRPAFAAALLHLMGGCAQLTVSVDVLDAEHVKDQIAEQALRNHYRDILHAPPGEFAKRVDRDFKAFQLDMVKLANEYTALSEQFPEAEKNALRAIAEGVRINVNGPTLKDRTLAQSNKIEALAQQLRVDAAETKWSGVGAVPIGLREQLASFSAAAKAPSVEQQVDIREYQRDRIRIAKAAAEARAAARVGAGAAASVPASIAAEVRAIDATPQAVAVVSQENAALAEAKRRSIIGGSEITHTEFAHIVARTDGRYWYNGFNQAFGSGTFGNVDVVIRMNSTADFSVKGMRFDATTVAQVASKVTTQALLIGAQMAGVPVASASTGTQSGGDALSKYSSDLASLQASLASREAHSEAQRSAMRALARSILGARAQMEASGFSTAPGSDPARKAMHESIDAAVNALRPLLVVQGLQ